MKNKIDCDIIGIIGQSGLPLGRMASNGVEWRQRNCGKRYKDTRET